ncbi:MAG: GTP cyclohydrolase I FolE [Kiritimatiellae bacterium]|nr:GTP cyclohydrolase I FolE [Kiritimatiellia bacterium]
MNGKRVQKLVRELLLEIGEDPDRDGLRKTPERVAKAIAHLTRGYSEKPHDVVNGAVFESGSDNMVVVRDIDVYSLCEHHLLPFFGHCHVGYISRGKVLGVSKIARIVDCLAARLQIQERLTSEIARAVRDETGAEGVGVVMECQHLCMMMRGVEKQNSAMATSSVLGSFHDDPATRAEFLAVVGRSHHR